MNAEENAVEGVGASRLVRLLDSGDASSHLMIDISGRGLPIADALEASGFKIVRVRKNGDGWSAVNPSPASEPTQTSENSAAGDGCGVSSRSDSSVERARLRCLADTEKPKRMLLNAVDLQCLLLSRRIEALGILKPFLETLTPEQCARVRLLIGV